MLITTVIALTRGVGRLGAAARYEREVGYHPSLPSIRTDAVWGIVLGSLRLWVLFALLAAFLLAALLMQPDAPGALVSYPDEHTEIRSRLVSGDRDERAMAARHALAAFDSGAPSAPRASDRPIFEDALTRAIEGGDAQAASDLASVLIAIGAGVDEVSAFYHGAEPEHRASLLSSAAAPPPCGAGFSESKPSSCVLAKSASRPRRSRTSAPERRPNASTSRCCERTPTSHPSPSSSSVSARAKTSTAW